MKHNLGYIIGVLIFTTGFGFWQTYSLDKENGLLKDELDNYKHEIRCEINQRNVRHVWPCSIVGRNIAKLE